MRQIPPGGEGKITVKVNTGGYGDRKIRESARIQTNDNTRPGFSVTVTGLVEKFADIRPQRILLKGAVGQLINARVEIYPKLKYPFNIIDVRARQGKFIRFKLTEKTHSDITGYVLSVENTKKEKGRYGDIIFLKTDNKIRPMISVPVIGNIIDRKQSVKTPKHKP